MCDGGDNTSTSKSSSTTGPQQYVQDGLKKLFEQAQGIGAKTYDPATGKQVAGFTGDQTQAQGQIRQDQGIAQPYIDRAAGFAGQAAGPISDSQIQHYQNPFTSQVIDATQAQFAHENALQQSQVTGNAALSGALGGNRVGVAQALAAEGQQRAQAPVLAGLRQSGYAQALSAAEQDQQRAQVAASQFGQIGNEAQSSAYRDAGALASSGAQEQGLSQSQADAAAQNAKDKQGFDYKNLAYQTGIEGQLGGAGGSTSTGSGSQTTPGPNVGSQILGGALTAASFLKDGGAVKQGFAAGGGPFESGIDYIPDVAAGAVPRAAVAPTIGPTAKQPSLADYMKQDRAAAGGFKNLYDRFNVSDSTNPDSWATAVAPDAGFARGGTVRGYADGGDPEYDPSEAGFDGAGFAAPTQNELDRKENDAGEQEALKSAWDQKEIERRVAAADTASANTGLARQAPIAPPVAPEALPELQEKQVSAPTLPPDAKSYDSGPEWKDLPGESSRSGLAAQGARAAPSKATVDFLKLVEGDKDNGWDVHQYSGPYGVKRGANERLTPEQAEPRLVQELSGVQSEMDKKINADLTPNKRTALTSFFQNLGTGNGRLDHVATLINTGRSDLVPSYMAQFTHADGKYDKGVENRRKQEIAMYNEGSGGNGTGSADTRSAVENEDSGAPAMGLGAGFKPEAANTSTAQQPPASDHKNGLSSHIFGLSDNQNQALRTAGLGMLSGQSNHFGVNVGAGGLEGMKTSQALDQRDVDNAIKKGNAELLAKEFSQKADQFNKEFAFKTNQPREIGVDKYGNKIFGTVDPVTGQARPLQSQSQIPQSTGQLPLASPVTSGPGPAKQSDTSPDDAPSRQALTLVQNPLLNGYDDGDKAQIAAILDGRAPLPSSNGRSNPRMQRLAELAHTLDPTLDVGRFKQRQDTIADFDPKGKNGYSIAAANLALYHGDTLLKDAQALNNGSVPAANAVSNALNRSLGNTSFQSREKQFQTLAHMFGEEVEKTVTGKPPTVNGTAFWASQLSANDSLPAIRGVITSAVAAMDGRLSNLADEKKRGMRTDTTATEFLNPATREIRSRLVGNHPTGAAPAAPVAPIPAATPADAAKLPLGTRFVTPDGQIRTRQ